MTSCIFLESSNLPRIWIQWYQHSRCSLAVPPSGVIPFHVASRMVCVTDKILQKWCFRRLIKGHKRHRASCSHLLSSIAYSGESQLLCCENTHAWRDSWSWGLLPTTTAPVKASEDTTLANILMATSWEISSQTYPAKAAPEFLTLRNSVSYMFIV